MFIFFTNALEPLSYLIYAISFLLYLRIDKRIKIKVLFIYYLVATLLMVKASLAVVSQTNNIEIYNLLFLFTFLALGFYFYSTLLSRVKRTLVVFFCFLDFTYYLINHFSYQYWLTFDSLGSVLLNTGIVVMTFFFLHDTLTHIKEEPLSLNFDFWYVSAQLIYFIGSFAIFLTYQYLIHKLMINGGYSYENRVLLTKVWGVHNVFLFFSSVMTSSSMLWVYYHRRSQ